MLLDGMDYSLSIRNYTYTCFGLWYLFSILCFSLKYLFILIQKKLGLAHEVE